MAIAKNTFTLSVETRRQFGDQAQWWGAVKPVPKSVVVAEAIRRAWEAEARSGKPKEKAK